MSGESQYLSVADYKQVGKPQYRTVVGMERYDKCSFPRPSNPTNGESTIYTRNFGALAIWLAFWTWEAGLLLYCDCKQHLAYMNKSHYCAYNELLL